jgi:uncharacterized membrane protein
MFQEITYHLIYGIPFIVYLGIVTIIMFIITALLAFLKRKGRIKMSINWHYRLAIISIVLGLIHGILGISAYF